MTIANVSIKPRVKLSDAFWGMTELAYQRMTAKEWAAILLAEEDRPTINGHIRQLVAKRLGYGVVEVTVKPLPVKEAV